MPRHHLSAIAHSTASPAAVFALLADIDTWSHWGRWTSTTLESTDPDGGGGVGAVRRLVSRSMGRTTTSRERVVEVVPNRRMGYELLSGLPLVGYRGLIELASDAAGGTTITWSSRFDARTPGTGWFYAAVLRWFIADAAKALARAAATARAAA